MALTKLNFGGKQQALAAANMPTGSVLQAVQNGSIAEDVNSNPGNFEDTNYTLSITPISASNKILIMMNFPFLLKGTGDKVRGGLKLNRAIGGSTTLIWNTNGYDEMFHARHASGTPDELTNLFNMSFLDAPNTTSATTYTMQHIMKNDSGASQSIAYGSARGGSIILLEIAG